MGLNNMGFGMVFSAQDLASNVVDRLSRNISGLDEQVEKTAIKLSKSLGVSTETLTTSLKGMALGAGTAMGGIAGLAASFNAAEKASAFERSLLGLQAATNFAAGDMADLEKAAKMASLSTTFTPVETIEALRSLATAGLDATASMSALGPVLDLTTASMGEIGLADAAGLATQSLRVFPDVAGDATLAMDLLVRGASRSSLAFNELPLALSAVGKSAGLVGATMEDTLAALGEVRNQVASVERGSTGLAVTMQRLVQPDVQKALKGLGVEAVNADGSFRPFLDVIGEVATATGGMTKAARAAFLEQHFGAEALTALNPLLGQLNERATKAGGGVDGMTKAVAGLRAEMRDTSITAKGFADVVSKSFAEQMKAATAAGEVIGTEIGLAFIDVLRPAIMLAVSALRTFGDLLVSLPKSVKQFGAAAFVIVSLSAAVVGLVIAVKAALPLIAAAAGLVGGSLLVVLSKVVLVVGAVSAVLYTLRAAWVSNFGGIQGIVLPIIDRVSLAVRSLYGLLVHGRIEGGLAGALLGGENTGVFAFVSMVSKAFATIQSYSDGLIQGISEGFGFMLDAIGPVFGEFAALASEAFGLMYEVLKPLLDAMGFKSAQGPLRMIGRVLGWIATGPLAAFVWALSVGLRGLILIGRIGVAVFRGIYNVVTGIGTGLDQATGAVFKFGRDIWTGITAPVRRVFDWLQAHLQGPMKALGLDLTSILVGPFVLLGVLAKTVWNGIKSMILAHINFLLSAFNMVIAGAATVMEAISPEAAAKLRTLVIGGVQDPDESGAPKSSGAISSSSSTPSTSPIATVPTSIPRGPDGGAIAAAALAKISADMAAAMAQQNNRPIQVQAEVVQDGQKIGRMQAQATRDAQARRGVPAQWR